mmetsp:Transcript_28977/g.81621  ORF Transcript_28977/g.81621 Transcript_28977/m.81621 type:complete len:202 (-) Transcript_28977:608-1213(-)
MEARQGPPGATGGCATAWAAREPGVSGTVALSRSALSALRLKLHPKPPLLSQPLPQRALPAGAPLPPDPRRYPCRGRSCLQRQAQPAPASPRPPQSCLMVTARGWQTAAAARRSSGGRRQRLAAAPSRHVRALAAGTGARCRRLASASGPLHGSQSSRSRAPTSGEARPRPPQPPPLPLRFRRSQRARAPLQPLRSLRWRL